MKTLFLFQRKMTPIRKLLMMKAVSGGVPLNEYTTTGNPLSFETNVAKPLKSLLIPWTPSQSGSGDPSPSNVRPISGVSGLTAWRTGKNLFDATTYPLTEDMWISASTGEAFENTTSGYACTLDYIPCSSWQGKTITLNHRPGKSAPGIAYYAEDKTFISGTANSGIDAGLPMTFIVPVNAVYLRFTTSKATKDETMLEIGESSSPYTPYVGTTIPVTIPALGKNLLNPATLEQGGIATNGSETIASNRIRTGFIPVEAGKKYTVSATGFISFMHFYDAEKENIGDNVGGVNITAPEDAKFVRCGFRKSDNVAIVPSDITDGQLEEGSSATAYEPYTNTVYGGSLDLTTGVMTATWAKVDASSFSWEKLAAQNPKGTAFNCSQAVPFKPWQNTYENAISNALVHASSSGAYRTEDANTFWWSDNRTGYRAVWGSPNAGASLDDFTAFLTDNNVVFVAELAEPVTYQLTPAQITTLVGDNVIWSDTNGTNTVTYLKRG